MGPVLRVYVATQWNTVTEVHAVTERQAPRASGRSVDYWADVTVDNNGGTPRRTEVCLSEGFVKVFNPDSDLTTRRFANDPTDTYCTREQIAAHFRRAVRPES